MRIGYETSSVSIKHPTGIARYIFNLLGAMQAGDVEPRIAPTLFYKASRWKKRQNWWRPEGVDVRLYQGRCWPLAKGVDIIHGLDGVVPRWKGVKRVVTVHDIFPILANDDFVAPTSFRDKKLKSYRKLGESDVVIAVSTATKLDLVETFGLPDEMIRVVPHGVEKEFFIKDEAKEKAVTGRLGISGDYCLFVGAISGRKNTARLVQAFAQTDAARETTLVLAGSPSYKGEQTLEWVERLGLADRVKILGFVDDNDLPALYSGASAFLFPTLYEGFGIPILEAMASGTPVLVGDRGSSPETGGGHAVEVDPYDIDAIARGIEDALAMSLEARQEARKHASRFTWNRCAVETIKVYNELLGA